MAGSAEKCPHNWKRLMGNDLDTIYNKKGGCAAEGETMVGRMPPNVTWKTRVSEALSTCFTTCVLNWNISQVSI
jgi:hypothetical protein